MIGDVVKVHLPGESPWAEVLEEKNDRIRGRINNKLFHDYSEHEQARWLKGEFDTVETLPKLHKFSQGDELWFRRGDYNEWVPDD